MTNEERQLELYKKYMIKDQTDCENVPDVVFKIVNLLDLAQDQISKKMNFTAIETIKEAIDIIQKEY